MPSFLEKRHYKTCPRILHVPNILISIDPNTENKSILKTQPNTSTIKLINFDATLKIYVICARFENSMGCKLITSIWCSQFNLSKQYSKRSCIFYVIKEVTNYIKYDIQKRFLIVIFANSELILFDNNINYPLVQDITEETYDLQLEPKDVIIATSSTYLNTSNSRCSNVSIIKVQKNIQQLSSF